VICFDLECGDESALDGAEVALAFKPREEWPKALRFYRLYR
jgi:hypothetical protein